MAEMSDVKKFVLGLTDKEIMALFGMVDKKKIFRLLYHECEEIFLMSNRNKL